jgi:hypothetical protein
MFVLDTEKVVAKSTSGSRIVHVRLRIHRAVVFGIGDAEAALTRSLVDGCAYDQPQNLALCEIMLLVG